MGLPYGLERIPDVTSWVMVAAVFFHRNHRDYKTSRLNWFFLRTFRRFGWICGHVLIPCLLRNRYSVNYPDPTIPFASLPFAANLLALAPLVPFSIMSANLWLNCWIIFLSTSSSCATS